MRFIKKLILFIALTANLSFFAQVYDINALAYQVRCIPIFAQELRQQNSSKAYNVAQWLDSKVIDQNYIDANIIKIANIIDNHALTTESKITIFYEMMCKETKERRLRKINGAIETLAVGIISAGALAFLIWAMIEDIKNPRPIFCVQSRPGITLTFKHPGGYINSFW